MMLDEKHQLLFFWYRKVGFKHFDPTAEVQIRDITKQGYHQYLTQDITINMKELNSRHKLYRKLDEIIREVVGG